MNNAIETGDGYRDLGMLEEARAAYRSVPSTDPDCGKAWGKLTWLSSRTAKTEQDALAEEGLAHIRAGRTDKALIQETALCLHFADRRLAAYRLLRQFQRQISWSAADHYGMACYASNIGYWAEAAWHLILCLEQGGDSHMFLDRDLEPLFRQAAEGDLNSPLALAIGHPSFADALQQQRGKCQEIDGMMEREIPSSLLAILVRNSNSGFLEVASWAGASEISTFRTWRDAVGGGLERLAETGIQRAREYILRSQIEWASEAAGMGDYLAARYHTIFALAHRPAWFERFEQRLAPAGIEYFFRDTRDAWREDPEYFRRVLAMTPMNQPPEALEEFSPAGRQSVPVRLIEAAAIHATGDREHHVRILGEVMRRWPRDPSAYLNAAMFAARRNRWDAARKLLAIAPASVHHLCCTRKLLRMMAARDERASAAFAGYLPFYGQPDIGGVVRRLDSKRIAFFRIRGTEMTVSQKIRPAKNHTSKSEPAILLENL